MTCICSLHPLRCNSRIREANIFGMCASHSAHWPHDGFELLVTHLLTGTVVFG
eukprot:m.1682244 g.1682244  ORF g.1682244 m.1682244 type:complete len:53 (+) comp231613_c0_seq1:71-229(+)